MKAPTIALILLTAFFIGLPPLHYCAAFCVPLIARGGSVVLFSHRFDRLILLSFLSALFVVARVYGGVE